jgi:hypothetical protein
MPRGHFSRAEWVGTILGALTVGVVVGVLTYLVVTMVPLGGGPMMGNIPRERRMTTNLAPVPPEEPKIPGR